MGDQYFAEKLKVQNAPSPSQTKKCFFENKKIFSEKIFFLGMVYGAARVPRPPPLCLLKMVSLRKYTKVVGWGGLNPHLGSFYSNLTKKALFGLWVTNILPKKMKVQNAPSPSQTKDIFFENTKKNIFSEKKSTEIRGSGSGFWKKNPKKKKIHKKKTKNFPRCATLDTK